MSRWVGVFRSKIFFIFLQFLLISFSVVRANDSHEQKFDESRFDKPEITLTQDEKSGQEDEHLDINKNENEDEQLNLIENLFRNIPNLETSENGKSAEINFKDLFQEMLNVLTSKIKQEEERKALYLTKLSPDHQELLQKAQNQYQNFLANVDIRNGLVEICKEIRQKLTVFAKSEEVVEAELIQQNLILIEKLQVAATLDLCLLLPKRMPGLNPSGVNDLSAAINGLIQNFMPEENRFNMVPGSRESCSEEHKDHEDCLEQEGENSVSEDSVDEEYFSFDDAGELYQIVTKLLKSNLFKVLKSDSKEYADLKRSTENMIGFFSDTLICLYRQDAKNLTLCYLRYLEPQSKEVRETLKATRKEFEEEVKDYIASQVDSIFISDQDLSEKELKQKAYVFWFKEIKKYQRTLMVFESLKNSTSSAFAGTEKLFDVVAYAYDITNCFYELLKIDLATKNQSQNVTLPLGPWGEHDFSVSKTSLFLNLLDWGFSAGMATWYFLLKKPDFTGGLLFNSILGYAPLNMVDVKQTMIFNFLVAPFALPVFMNPSFWNWKPPYVVRSMGKVLVAWAYYYAFYTKLFPEEDIKEGWGPSTNRHFKGAIFNFLRILTLEVSKRLAQTVRYKTDPVAMENIENYTLGVVKPEMITYFIDLLLPVLICKTNPLPEFVNYDSLSFLIGRAISRRYESFDDDTKKKMSLEAYYIECNLIYYLASNIGKTLGANFARRFQEPLVKVTSAIVGKSLDGLASIGLISKDTREFFTALREEIDEGVEENIQLFKALVQEALKPDSPLRLLVVSHLKKRGNLSADDAQSVERVNQELLSLFLFHCSIYGFITHLDAANIMRHFLQKRQLDEEIIGEILTSVKNNLIAFAGGFVGQGVASIAAHNIMMWKGPFYPKIKDAFGCA